MKTIPLTQGKETLVDDCDYEYLMQWKWYYRPDHKGGYAVRMSKCNGKRVTIRMQRVIAERMGLQIVGKEVDHTGGSKLNNSRSKLRIATTRQNCANKSISRNNTSGFKGVSWNRQYKKWRVSIGVNWHRVYISRYDDKLEAARAYNVAAKKYFGDFAWLNRVSDRRVNTFPIKIERRQGQDRRILPGQDSVD